MPHGAAHRLRRKMCQAALPRQFPGQRAIGGGLPIGDLQQKLPHRPLKIRAHRMQRRSKIRLPAGKVGIQPAAGLFQSRRALLLPLLRQSGRKVLLSFQPQTGQTLLIGSQQQASQRGGVMGNKAAHGISSLQALLYHYYTTKAPACPVFPPWFGLFTKSRWNGRAAACYNREK